MARSTDDFKVWEFFVPKALVVQVVNLKADNRLPGCAPTELAAALTLEVLLSDLGLAKFLPVVRLEVVLVVPLLARGFRVR